MANIICFKQEKGLKNCQLKVKGVGHCPMCSVLQLVCLGVTTNFKKKIKLVSCVIRGIGFFHIFAIHYVH